MVTRVLLVEAAPTPWDVEGRFVGRRALPLTDQAVEAIARLVDDLPYEIDEVYRPAANEACDQASRLISQKFTLRPRNSPNLENIALGLWEGLTHDDVATRFPTVFPQWWENPLTVNPPEGEPTDAAISRIGDAVRRIVSRNRGSTIALALRPRAMQVALGTLRHESHPTIASHLHQSIPAETIEIE